MGDMRTREGMMEHERAPGEWVRILPDACGQPLQVCLHGHEPKAAVDSVTGLVVVEIGGHAAQMPKEMAASLAAALRALEG